MDIEFDSSTSHWICLRIVPLVEGGSRRSNDHEKGDTNAGHTRT